MSKENLSPTERTVFLKLLMMSDPNDYVVEIVYYGRDKLAREIGCSHRSMLTFLLRLVHKGYIENLSKGTYRINIEKIKL